MAKFTKIEEGIKFEFNSTNDLEKEIARKITKERNAEQSHVTIAKTDIAKAVKTVFYLYKDAFDKAKNPYSSGTLNAIFITQPTEQEKSSLNSKKDNIKEILTSFKKCILEFADTAALNVNTEGLLDYCEKKLAPKTGARKVIKLFSPYESGKNKYSIIQSNIKNKKLISDKDLLGAVMDVLIEYPEIADERFLGNSKTTAFLVDLINNAITVNSTTNNNMC